MDEVFKKDALLAGRIAGQARDYGANLIKPGASVREILDKVEAFIKEQGAQIAFPAQISLNQVAAHACSDSQDQTIIQESDVVKLDCGAHVNGMIGDTAITVNCDGAYADLVAASKKALDAATPLFTPGTSLGEIGRTIQQTISDLGFSPVKNLSGHGLGHYDIHTSPSVPNVAITNAPILKEGMHLACEPFATDGKGEVTNSGTATVFTQVGAARVRSASTRQVLKRIESFQGLPFAARWLEHEFGVGKARLALKELSRLGCLQDHPPLKEVANGMVSQREHSFIVADKPIATTKFDD